MNCLGAPAIRDATKRVTKPVDAGERGERIVHGRRECPNGDLDELVHGEGGSCVRVR